MHESPRCHRSLVALEQQSKNRDVSIIGIHPLKNRLFRVLLNANAQRSAHTFVCSPTDSSLRLAQASIGERKYSTDGRDGSAAAHSSPVSASSSAKHHSSQTLREHSEVRFSAKPSNNARFFSLVHKRPIPRARPASANSSKSTKIEQTISMNSSSRYSSRRRPAMHNKRRLPHREHVPIRWSWCSHNKTNGQMSDPFHRETRCVCARVVVVVRGKQQ